MKRQRFEEWIFKNNPTICCLQGIHFRFKDTKGFRVKRWKKVFYVNSNQESWGGYTNIIQNRLK